MGRYRMKHLPTKERAVARREFAYMYRKEITELTEIKDKQRQKEFVDRIARPFLGYNPVTDYQTIFYPLRRILTTIIQLQKQQ